MSQDLQIILVVLMSLGLPIFALSIAYLIYGIFKYFTAPGYPEKVRARKIIIFSIGVIILLIVVFTTADSIPAIP